MHEDLAALQALWNNVHAGERLRAERAAQAEKERLLGAAADAAREAVGEAERALKEILDAERQVMRRLDAYRKRIETTKAMIEAGKAPDYRLADQQLRSCVEIADQLETEALEAMERRDAAEAKLAGARDAQVLAHQKRDQLQVRWEARQPALEADLAALDAARPGLEALVPTEIRSAFAALRARGRSGVSQIKDGACSVCNYGIPTQTLNEIQAAVRVHACRNCGRFLLPEEP